LGVVQIMHLNNTNNGREQGEVEYALTKAEWEQQEAVAEREQGTSA
jgi:hypothetical protein